MPFTFTDAAGRQIDGIFKIVRPEAEKALEKELELWPELGKALEEICLDLNLPVLEFAGPLSKRACASRRRGKTRPRTDSYPPGSRTLPRFSEIALPELLPWCTLARHGNDTDQRQTSGRRT